MIVIPEKEKTRTAFSTSSNSRARNGSYSPSRHRHTNVKGHTSLYTACNVPTDNVIAGSWSPHAALRWSQLKGVRKTINTWIAEQQGPGHDKDSSLDVVCFPLECTQFENVPDLTENCVF